VVVMTVVEMMKTLVVMVAVEVVGKVVMIIMSQLHSFIKLL